MAWWGRPQIRCNSSYNKKALRCPEAGWRYATPEEMQRQIKLGLVEFREDHTEPPFRKAHIRPIAEEVHDGLEGADDDVEEDSAEVELATQVRGTYFYKQSQVAVKYLRNLMGAKVFSNPKDHEELARLIEYVTPCERNAIVMDFFAGSASSAEAVFGANATYGTNHTFIMVQLPESLEDALASTTGTAKKTVQAAIKMLKKAIVRWYYLKFQRNVSGLLEKRQSRKGDTTTGGRMLAFES